MAGMMKYIKENLPIKYRRKHRRRRIKLNLINSGSFYDQTRIGKPSEFDFAIMCDFTTFHPKECVEEKVLVDIFYPKIKSLCDEYMRQVDLPSAWSHGGFDSPNYSGYRKNGSLATMFLLKYHPINHAPLPITVDLVIGHIAGNEQDKTDGRSIFHKLCETYSENVWTLSCSKQGLRHGITSPGHDDLLWLFDQDSAYKIIIRLLKKFNNHKSGVFNERTHKKKADSNHGLSTIWQDLTEADSPSEKISVLHKYGRKQLLYGLWPHRCHFREIEMYPEQTFISTYDLHLLVMLLFDLEYKQRRNVAPQNIWTKEDIPRIILRIFDILHMSLSRKPGKIQLAQGLAVIQISNSSEDYHELRDSLTANGRFLTTETIEHVEAMMNRVKDLVECKHEPYRKRDNWWNIDCIQYRLS